MAVSYIQDDAAMLDYGFTWTDWLGADTIQGSTWTVPAGMTASNESHTTTTTTVWLSGGVIGQSYRCVNQITTAAGRIDERTLIVIVEDV